MGGPGIGEITDAIDILLIGALAAAGDEAGDTAAGLRPGRELLAGAGWMASLAVVCAAGARDEDWA